MRERKVNAVHVCKRVCVCMCDVTYLLLQMFPVAVGVANNLVGEHLELSIVEELVGNLQDGRMRPGRDRRTYECIIARQFSFLPALPTSRIELCLAHMTPFHKHSFSKQRHQK